MLTELRCQKCNKLLVRYQECSQLEIKCPRCHSLNRLVTQTKSLKIQGTNNLYTNQLANTRS
ncbi:MAG: Com family DNA-binding transcriptional regulator [Syntrophomonas sp.]|nr:Com family DNA-binding transcriptional regulator [Syntrophomonas sp.]